MEYPPYKKLDIEELLTRLESAIAAKSLSPADRILEFGPVLRALRLMFSTDKTIYELLDRLLKTLKPYKANFHEPNAATFYRVTKPVEFAEIIPKLEGELKKRAAANAGGRGETSDSDSREAS